MALVRKQIIMGGFWAASAILMWSGSLVLLRHGVTTHLNAYDLTALRFGSAGLALLPVLVTWRAGLARVGVVRLFLMICGFGAPYIILISTALKTAPASAAGALNPGVMAVSAVLFGAILFRDQLRTTHILGILLIMAAMSAQTLWNPSGLAEGHLILIVTGILWTIYAMVVRLAGISALHATAIVAVGSALLYLPVYLIILPKQITMAPLHDIVLQAVFQGLLVSVLAVYAFNRSAELLGSVIGSTLPALIPLVTLILGAVVLAEPFQGRELITAVVIGLGVALILTGRGVAGFRR